VCARPTEEKKNDKKSQNFICRAGGDWGLMGWRRQSGGNIHSHTLSRAFITALVQLARMLRELPELSVDFTSAAWSIVRRGTVLAKSQAGSAKMCREIRRQTGSGTK
jgi:hypothetical protein